MSNLAAQQYLIDVRTPEEFATGSLKGANNVEYQNITQFLIDQRDVARDADITLYCRSGRRSAIAKAELDALGFSNVRDLGSFDAARDVLENESQMHRVVPVQPKPASKMKQEKLQRSTNALLEGLRGLEWLMEIPENGHACKSLRLDVIATMMGIKKRLVTDTLYWTRSSYEEVQNLSSLDCASDAAVPGYENYQSLWQSNIDSRRRIGVIWKNWWSFTPEFKIWVPSGWKVCAHNNAILDLDIATINSFPGIIIRD
jgi:rhodanese-related sulfurtransferase